MNEEDCEIGIVTVMLGFFVIICLSGLVAFGAWFGTRFDEKVKADVMAATAQADIDLQLHRIADALQPR